MQNRKKRFQALVVAASVPVDSTALGADYTWSDLPGGSQACDSAANCGGAGFPDTVLPTVADEPLAHSDSGNVSVNLVANLTLNVPVGGASVSTLSIGGTGAAVTTNITGGPLSFGNQTWTGAATVATS